MNFIKKYKENILALIVNLSIIIFSYAIFYLILKLIVNAIFYTYSLIFST